MAPQVEDSGHGNSGPTSNSVCDGQSSQLGARLCYTQEDLLRLNPVKNKNLKDKTGTSFIIEEQPSSIIDGKRLKDVKSAQFHSEAEATPVGDDEIIDLDEAVLEKKKKKKKRSGKSKNKQQAPNGFEEYFADTPITPEEYDEEKTDIYHPSRSFVERIQQCIQRYRARRKLDSERSNIFSKYLVLGGVDAGVKAFTGGLDKETLENSTAAEIADIQATDHIRSHGPVKFYNAGDPVNWVVDFEGVAKGFLSELAPSIFGIREREIKQYCGVISNFLSYVLLHDVCNEYQMSVMAALRVCATAEKELQLIGDVSKLLPGDFNIAASTLYGGSYHQMRNNYAQWDSKEPLFEPDDPAYQNKKIMGMTVAEADRIFKTGIAFSGTYDHFEKIMAMQCHVVKEQLRPMEVCEIVLPTQSMREKLVGARDEFGYSGIALGILKVKPWDCPDAQEEDMSNDIGHSSNKNAVIDTTIDSFWLEENILDRCFVGMKFTAMVRELSIGLKYIDEVMRVECSFYTYLETERLDRWKEPKLSERPGPSADDPERNFADDVDFGYD